MRSQSQSQTRRLARSRPERFTFNERLWLVLTFLTTFAVSTNIALILFPIPESSRDGPPQTMLDDLHVLRLSAQPSSPRTLQTSKQPYSFPVKQDDVGVEVAPRKVGQVSDGSERSKVMEQSRCSAQISHSRVALNAARREDVEVYYGWKVGEMFAKRDSNTSGIVLTTQLSLNRLERLETLVSQWNSSTSAAVYLCSEEELHSVKLWYSRTSERFKAVVAMHVVVGKGEFYPVNLMRNVALEGVQLNQTGHVNQEDHVLLLDVDAQLSSNASAVMADVLSSLVYLQRTADMVAMVVPAFQFKVPADQRRVSQRSELLSLWKEGKIQAMHAGRPSYSGPFRHEKWLYGNTRENEVTKIKHLRYQLMFEPYIVLNDASVRFDESFVGRGFNKQSFHFQLWASGYEYFALPNIFVIDTAHKDSSWDQGSGAFSENRVRWLALRDKTIEQYNLDCREIYLRQCDRHGRNCDKACRRMDQHPSRRKQPHREHKRPKSKARGDFKGYEDEHKRKKHIHEVREDKWWNEQVARMTERARSGVRSEDDHELKSSLPRCAGGVDVVYTWVNGSDPWHLSVQDKWIPAHARDSPVDLGGKKYSDGGKASMPAGDLAFRFRDFDEASTLRYSLRSFLKFAPWVNRFWIVTAGRYGNKSDPQVPSWLDLGRKDSRIRVVAHEDIFDHPEAQLPTLNSCAIETRLHHIPGLSQCYIYVNDDFMLLAPLSMEDLWDRNEPLPYAFFTGVRMQRIAKDPWAKKVVNVGRMIHRDVGVPWDQLFHAGHYGHFAIKEVALETERALQQDYDRTSRERWRTDESLWVPFVYANYYAWNYAAKPKKVDAFYHRLTDAGGVRSVNRMFDTLLKPINSNRWTWLCVNDLLSNLTDEVKEALIAGFDRMYPEKSSFEKG